MNTVLYIILEAQNEYRNTYFPCRIDSMQGVSVETHTDATNADLSDDENDSSDSESDDDE